MKKFYWLFLLMLGIVLTGCKDDDEPFVPFALNGDGVEGFSGNTLNVFGNQPQEVHISLVGVGESAGSTVEYDAANESKEDWLYSEVKKVNSTTSGDSWIVVLKIDGYDRNKLRKGTITLTNSLNESIELHVHQQGAPIPGLLKFAEGQPEEFSDGTLSIASVSDKTVDISVMGITEGLTAEVRQEDVPWLSAKPLESDGKISVTAKGFLGTEDRTGIITIKSGIDELVLRVVQAGIGSKAEMVVVCEGQMNALTGALSVINYDGTVVKDIYRQMYGQPMGDVAQSLTYIDGKYFVVMNNSKLIRVLDAKTFELLGTINYTQAGSPRFMVKLNDTEALVSDLNKQLVKINYKNYTVVEYIDMKNAPYFNQIEKMVRVGDKIFCAAIGSGQVWMYDANNFDPLNPKKITIRGTMKTAKMIEDKNGKLWVMGSYGVYEYPKLFCIDPVKGEVDTELTFEVPVFRGGTNGQEGCVTGFPFYCRMETDRTKGKLYFYAKGWIGDSKTETVVFSFDVDSRELKPYRHLSGLDINYIYGMGISPDAEVYICDCMNYSIQEAYLRHYKADGTVDSKEVGIYPRMVHFTEYDN